ncbi:MAG: GntR family transcriptional regulator [bacterium]|nr:GntR family transcriptional regulator [bacterium]
MKPNFIPLKEQIYLYLKKQISCGKFMDKLPPERKLAVELAVGRPALRSAIQTLVRDGSLISIQGKGNIIRSNLACLSSVGMTMPTEGMRVWEEYIDSLSSGLKEKGCSFQTYPFDWRDAASSLEAAYRCRSENIAAIFHLPSKIYPDYNKKIVETNKKEGFKCIYFSSPISGLNTIDFDISACLSKLFKRFQHIGISRICAVANDLPHHLPEKLIKREVKVTAKKSRVKVLASFDILRTGTNIKSVALKCKQLSPDIILSFNHEFTLFAVQNHLKVTGDSDMIFETHPAYLTGIPYISYNRSELGEKTIGELFKIISNPKRKSSHFSVGSCVRTIGKD